MTGIDLRAGHGRIKLGPHRFAWATQSATDTLDEPLEDLIVVFDLPEGLEQPAVDVVVAYSEGAGGWGVSPAVSGAEVLPTDTARELGFLLICASHVADRLNWQAAHREEVPC